MIEMFVRQKTKYPCSNLYNLPNGEFLRIGHDFNSQSKFLTFNKKSGDQMSLSFNGFKNNTDHFVFREVSMFFSLVSKFNIGDPKIKTDKTPNDCSANSYNGNME